MSISALVEKWQPILENDKVPSIKDEYRAKVTAQLLENQEKFLAEAASTVAGNVQNHDPILISLVRRMAPKLIAYDICGVQPMNGPTGLVFAMRSRYTNGSGDEALFNEANTQFSGDNSVGSPAHAGTDMFDSPFTSGRPMTTAQGETETWNSMSLTIEKVSVTAKTRQLRADYSLELAQDLRVIHGLDAENELTNILSQEITQEINREVVRTVYKIAKAGAAYTAVPGSYNLEVDGDGRWFVERVKGLFFALEREANAIAYETRRGKGNVIITTADVASALAMVGILNYAPALQQQIDLNVDTTGVTYAGQAGRFNVFVDPYLTGSGAVIGFKGVNAYDAGLFYCPYVPLQMVRATSVDQFQPAIGFKTRYGMVANPFVTNGLNAGSNSYYRKVKVLGLNYTDNNPDTDTGTGTGTGT